MAGYVWSINDVVWNETVPPLPVSAGQRVELVFDNQTPMPHPMQLHGHTFQVVEINGKRFAGARRDTVLVPPSTRVVVAFDCRQSRLVGFTLPPDLPHGRRDVHQPCATSEACAPNGAVGRPVDRRSRGVAGLCAAESMNRRAAGRWRGANALAVRYETDYAPAHANDSQLGALPAMVQERVAGEPDRPPV